MLPSRSVEPGDACSADTASHPSDAGGPAELARRGVRAVEAGMRSVATHPTVRTGWSDACEAAVRLLRSMRLPTRKELLDFLGHQALVNTVAWGAGLTAAGLVTRFFEQRGLRNLWGLIPTGHRALVSPEDYRLILSLASFCAGLSMMVFVRHILLRWIAEVRAIRRERRGLAPPGVATSELRGPGLDGLELYDDDR